MDRQLSPNFFNAEIDELRNAYSNDNSMNELPEAHEIGKQHLNQQQINQQNKVIETLQMKMEKMAIEMTEYMRQSRSDIVQMDKKIQRIESSYLDFRNNTNQKVSSVEMKFSERNMMDNKVRALIDRQHSSMISFENRLKAMKRMLDEKEMQNSSMNAALKEARLEIRRLKLI